MPQDLEIRIRNATDQDAKIFLSILSDSIRQIASKDYSDEIIQSWAPQINETSIQHYLDNPEGELRFIAEIDGNPVGLGSTVIHKSELRACYVSAAGARKRVGTAIVKHLENTAIANGLEHFVLDATLTAEPFYQALGYASLERIVHRTSSGANMQTVSMRKKL